MGRLIKMETGVKHDSGKTQWWYIDNFWPQLEEVVQVLTMGDKKYPSADGSNWKRVEGGIRRYNDALLRHTIAYRRGEKVDPESGKSHLAHVITNALFLMYNDSLPENAEEYHLATLEKVEQIILEVEENCTNYSSPLSRESDRAVIQPHLDAILDEVQELKDNAK